MVTMSLRGAERSGAGPEESVGREGRRTSRCVEGVVDGEILLARRKVEGGRLRLWRMAVGGPLATMPHACCRPRPAAGRMSFCDDPNRGYAPESLSCHVELLSYDTLL